MPVRHEKGSDQKAAAEEKKKDFQKRCFRKGVQTFQSDTSVSW